MVKLLNYETLCCLLLLTTGQSRGNAIATPEDSTEPSHTESTWNSKATSVEREGYNTDSEILTGQVTSWVR